MGNISSINFTSSTNVNINGNPTTIYNSTYYLDIQNINYGGTATVQNNTTGQVIVKLWSDFSGNKVVPPANANEPSGQIIIDGSNITIDGQGLLLDLSRPNYDGLVKSITNANSLGIQLNNINIKIDGTSTLTPYGGWVCHGQIPTGCDILFNNCHVVSDNSMNFVQGSTYPGGICGGGNNNNISTFTNCSVITTNDLTLTTNINLNNYSGGICGGSNTISGNYTFSNCQVKSMAGQIINSHSGVNNNWCGGICAGTNFGTMIFTECIVEAYNSITFQSVNQTNWGGGICGGRNDEATTGNVDYTFTNCQVNALNGDVILNGFADNFGGGICGGNTNGGLSIGLSTFTFNLCFVNPSIGNFIYSGFPIPKPNTNRTTLKNKIMIGQCDLDSQNQIQIDCVSQLLEAPNYSCNTEPLPPVPPVPPTPTPAPPSNISPLGGGFQGFEPKMVVLVEGGGGRSMTRRILRDAFGTGANNKTRKCTTPFRISVNESCAGKPGKAAVIYSGSDYIRFKKLVAVNKNYNDSSFGGDNNHGSYDALKRARH